MGRPLHMRHRRRRGGLVLAGALTAIAAVAAGVAIGLQTGPPGVAVTPPHRGQQPTGLAGGGGPGADVVAGLGNAGYGQTAAWVVAENAKPGSAAWRIAGPAAGHIEGFADRTSASTGGTVRIYVSTDAPTFQVLAYRMGWYGGLGARLVWTSPTLRGIEQAPCRRDPSTNMVSCDQWIPSVEVPITADFVPGDYLMELVGSGGQRSYVPLTVTDPASHATYLVENDIYTWQAWNDYGGYDFYSGVGSCPPGVYPRCDRAREVSFDRPYADGQGAADFLGNEYPLVRFVEEHGLDVTYATSADIEADPSMLLRHRALLSLGHDECWSYQERLAAQQAEAAGVNMIFFGASAMLRHVRMEASPLGPYRQEIDYRDSSADPLLGRGDPREVTGNTWSDPPALWSEVPFVGGAYTGYVLPGRRPVDFVVYDGSSWLFAGTGLSTGAKLPGLLVSDFDQVQPGVSPANVQVLAHSPMPLGSVQTNVRKPASDVTYWTDAKSGAGVFDSGTVTWIPDLQSSPAVERMTGNLLALFGRGPAGAITPSVPNWRQLYG